MRATVTTVELVGVFSSDPLLTSLYHLPLTTCHLGSYEIFRERFCVPRVIVWLGKQPLST